MGASISTLFTALFGKRERVIVMLGLDAAGKTTILYQLQMGKVVETIPTIGFNVETVECKNVKFCVWDAGGQEKCRSLWSHYFLNASALIWVVDSNDLNRMNEAKAELMRNLREDQLKDSVLLVLANKQDLPDALSPDQLSEMLQLKELNWWKWKVVPTCATKGEGLWEGLEWASENIK